MSSRHYYAVRYAYPRAISDADILAQFSGAQERREYIQRMNSAGYFGDWEPVTLAEVRHRFDLRDFSRDPRHLEEPTDAGSHVPYIHQRAGYQI